MSHESSYLDEENEERRTNKLIERLANEAVLSWPGGRPRVWWCVTSDYHRLPIGIQDRVKVLVMRRILEFAS